MGFSLNDLIEISQGERSEEFKKGRVMEVWIKPKEKQNHLLFTPYNKPQHYGIKTTAIIEQDSLVAKLQSYIPITLYRNDVIKFQSGKIIVLKNNVNILTTETIVPIYKNSEAIGSGEEGTTYEMLPLMSVKEGAYPQPSTSYAEAHNKSMGWYAVSQKIKKELTATLTGDINIKDPCFETLKSIYLGTINKLFVQIRDMPLQENYGQSPMAIEFWATPSVTLSDTESGFVNFSMELKVIGRVDDYTIPTGIFFTLRLPSITLVSSNSVDVTQLLLLTANVTVGSYDIDKVEFYQNGILLDEDLTKPYTTSVAFDASELGNNTFYAIVYDSEGNQVQSNTKTVEVTYTPPTISVRVSPSSVNENELIPMVYTFTRNGFTGVSTSVTYGISGTAINGIDYNNIGTSINFEIGESTKTVNIIPIDNDIVASNKTVTLTINSGGDYSVGNPNSATGTIVNDDLIPKISLSVLPNSVLENSGTPLVYTFTRTVSTTRSTTVNYTIGGTAVNGTDYQTISTSVVFEIGETIKTVQILPIDNDIVASSKTISLTLVENEDYERLTTNAVIGTIVNDDVIPEINLSVSPSSVNENEWTPLVYTFTRTLSTSRSVSVSYSIGGSAVNGIDYQTITTSVVFEIGETTKTVQVIPINNNTIASNKTVSLTLNSGEGYSVGTSSSATGTIVNDDTISVISLSVSPSSVEENSGQSLVYTFARAAGDAITVNYSIGGTAVNGTDYQAIETFIDFETGEVAKYLYIRPINNDFVNQNKTVILTLASGVGYIIGTTTSVVGTIVNDDIETYYCPQDITGFYDFF